MLLDWHSHEGELVPFVLKIDCSDFEKFVKILNGMATSKKMPEGYVNCTTLWMVNDNEEIIGITNIRHKLNEQLHFYGGHIGYGVTPSMRNKGYATEMLKLAILEARKMGIQDIRMTCNSRNLASERVILKNGGIFDTEVDLEQGIREKCFWIK